MKGLGIDGIREMLITALEGRYAKSREKQNRDDETVDK